MRRWIRALDQVLRGQATRPDEIHDTQIDIPAGGLCFVLLLLAMFHGLCVGSFSLFKEIDESVFSRTDRYWQLLASTVKVPALFCLTLLVTFPSLYVFNALVGSRLNIAALFRLLIAALCVNLSVLASFGTIVAFFSVSTASYHFILLFNVVVFALAGALGLVFLTQTLNRMSQARLNAKDATFEKANRNDKNSSNDSGGTEDEGAEDDAKADDDSESDIVVAESVQPGALDQVEGHVLGRHVKTVIRIWMVVFALVAQMGWVLRPFIGSPDMPFQWFRARESNFFEGVWRTIEALLKG